MKNSSSRKGFTVVELVIVIAVIAILAAVLIPTFSSLVKKANTSADIQAARQMNTFLAADGAVVATTPGRLFDVLSEGGYNAKNYTPLVKDRYFFWDRGLNMILYVDGSKNVIFPENVTPTADWYSLSGDFIGEDSTITLPAAPTDGDTFTVASGADFIAAAEYINEKASEYENITGSIDIVIELTGDIDLQGADVNFTQQSTTSVNVTLKSNKAGTKRTIKNLYISDQHTTSGNDSDGNASNTYGHSLFNYVNNLTVSDIAIEYSAIGGYEASQGGFFAGQVSGDTSFTNVSVTNCDIQASRKVGVLCGYTHGNVTFNNVTIDKCNVTASQGEAGIVFGVMEVSKVSKNDKVVSGTVTVTNSTVNIANNSVKTVKDSSNNSYTVVEYVDGGKTKYRVATANFAFYSISNDPVKTDVTGDGTGDLAAYPALDTLDAFLAAKGVK